MRYFTKVDLLKVKELTMGLVTFHPNVPEGIGVLFSFTSSWSVRSSPTSHSAS